MNKRHNIPISFNLKEPVTTSLNISRTIYIYFIVLIQYLITLKFEKPFVILGVQIEPGRNIPKELNIYFVILIVTLDHIKFHSAPAARLAERYVEWLHNEHL